MLIFKFIFLAPYYLPPIALGIADPPLKAKGHLTVGYGDSGSVPHWSVPREGQNVDVGMLKLFVSRKQVNLTHVAQSSPFAPVGGHSTAPSPSFGDRSTPSSPYVSSRGTFQNVMPEDFEHLPWDTIEIPMVHRRHQQSFRHVWRQTCQTLSDGRIWYGDIMTLPMTEIFNAPLRN